ncbi:MAG TPA: cytochrome c-type biogenesis CcmF C-terminal domain-containing protein [Polyangiaceae bacterium LLY-WYZ-15_(1-7)]|nr:cytochrome C biogenesis protein [Myxococcales bacterium]MBJ74605.1 cytochrome C biogenesis protein [Sandaracinus sp.]HJK89619.1 cytochrome c-type biogenesis CcmF C-terminal domain-containing protein [Polyangiaceae bacterium LLY-WYZ-15_(1-7)]HJL02930.1 cytochrome c-type biogenesis CcmF C-terminal domain-containing protein [Polyangiaceae bacterium LLY-WYZ-15_(1-7)]HJL13682.1 cytochrome c-type biogenesis CcmF C-terminal domain-containing protein [Polyangiaceae bacterium LLY-WYZ-15_(1-7)]
MPTIDVPFYGNLVLGLVLVSAAYTFAMALGAARGRPQLLSAARFGTYATCAFVALGVCLLAYAFQTHDFRIRYVARYSDRSMPWWYLVTSLWGGQDGSLLWWSFLLAGYTAACTRWLRGRYLELQPYIYATLMSILAFFVVLMLFAANPFATTVAAAPPDGEGLNPLLQNYWMVIHPPALYMGFVGWAIPFAFVVAALMTKRLGDEWIKGARLWAMIAWMFLSIGLILGCLWSYEELGWGGYWAWDPVENASFMPWLVGTAYLHSAIVQERYGMLKIWNVFLLLLTFWMTIFGTFLTRSGMIASVHSFARSDIGIFFVYYLIALAVALAALVIWRLPVLKSEHRIEALLSREFAFLLNNWVLLGMMIFVLGATTWPLVSEWLRGQEVTVGPGFYNQWMVPFGLILLVLMGYGPLISWRKATGKNMARAFLVPLVAAGVFGAAHLLVGDALGFPAIIDSDEIYATFTGRVLAGFQSVAPLLSLVVITFVVVGIGQEFWRGARVRMRNKGEGFLTALTRLTMRARRRYGGYIVHIGIALMYFGFTGAAYDVEEEAALHPGDTMTVPGYEFRYDRPRSERDPNRRMVFTDMTVLDGDDGEALGRVAPAKFIYRTMPEQPTTEVAIRTNLREDLYVIMSTVDPNTQRATFRVILRPLVVWIWIGGIILVLGSVIAMWPRARDVLARQEQLKRKRRRGGGKGAAAAAAVLLLLGLLLAPGLAAAQEGGGSSSLHAGTVVLHDPTERHLFGHLLCQCGGCQRLPLDSCACEWADERRAEMRARLARGETPEDLIAAFRAQYGPAAISIPPDEGMDRAMWAIPVAAVVLAAGGIFMLGRRWKRRSASDPEHPEDDGPAPEDAPERDYDALLEDELRRLEGDR